VVQIRLFGGVRATNDAGQSVDVGPAKCQALLAALALSSGSAVPVPRLVELVWGENAPRTAEKTLQSYVTKLRKGLGNDAIVRTGSAYRLDVSDRSGDVTDVARFQRHLAAGEVDAALSEWSGAPLAGLDAPGLTATVEALVEQWLGAVEVQLGQAVDDDASAAIGPLTELTARHPFREGLWALLMTALYKVGRQADALSAYRRARLHLVEHLGVEPGPHLRELEALILGHDERLRVDRSAGGRGAGGGTGLPTGTVTFGFSDLDDAASLTDAALARHDELVTSTARRHGGHIFATSGDSFGVAFHRAGDAAAWAGELHDAMSTEPWLGAPEVQLRIGLHTGETQERGRGYFGPAVIVAARLAASGHGGQTLVSGVTAGLLDGVEGIALHDLGRFRLDGVVAEHRILQLGQGEHPPLRTEASRRSNLPRRQDRLIGRDDDLETVAGALASSPVVTLVGPGGIGKTRLALAAAHRAEADPGGGAWLVELAEVASPDDVARAVADVLAVRDSPGRSLTQSVVTALEGRRALLVLDNCEHVIEGAAALARALADGCPQVRVLATSREGLGVGVERLVAVAPLDPTGPGVELFDERALAASSTFDPVASRPAVEEICRRLDGVPLAIELAAARTRSLSPTDLVERLDDRLRLLTGGRRTTVERHRTLRTTIQWSYDLLTPLERVLFQRLSIFAGPFDLAAAETVAANGGLAARTVAAGGGDGELDPVDVDELVGGLVDRSMVVVESGPFGHRFRLLETMRQFAGDLLSDSGDTDRVAKRHAGWALDRVRHIGTQLAGPAEIEAVARLNELWPNLRAAVEWGCARGNRRLVHDLIRPVVTEVYVRSQSEIGYWAERLLALTPEGDPDDELVMFGLTWAARRYMRTLDLAGYERLVARYGEPDHPMLRYARAYITSDLDGRAEWAPKALTELRDQGETYVADLFELAAVAMTLLLTGRFTEHDPIVTVAVERHRQGGAPTCLQWALTYLGTSASLQGRSQQAWQLYDEASWVPVPERTQTMRNPLEARAAMRRGDRALAYALLRDHVRDLIDRDDIHVAWVANVEFVDMMARVDRLADAARILGHLEAAGRLDEGPSRAMVADAADRISAATDLGGSLDIDLDNERALGRELDDRQALAHVRAVLDHLIAGEPADRRATS
jgi:predicted ATPase/DNA-binding SARP family transcriptional activator